MMGPFASLRVILPGALQNEPLATTFPCLFCNHEKSVTVKLDKKSGVGQLSCKVCNQQFQCAVNCELAFRPISRERNTY